MNRTSAGAICPRANLQKGNQAMSDKKTTTLYGTRANGFQFGKDQIAYGQAFEAPNHQVEELDKKGLAAAKKPPAQKAK